MSVTGTHPTVDAHFAALKDWRAELFALRAVLLASPLREDYKWRSPCYTYRKVNIATIWGLKTHAVLAFFKGVELSDPAQILIAPSTSSPTVRMATFTSTVQVQRMELLIRNYIDEAIAIEDAKRNAVEGELVWPDELVAAVKANPALGAAFTSLPPGHQRGYLQNFSAPGGLGTVEERIERHISRILDGKGLRDD